MANTKKRSATWQPPVTITVFVPVDQPRARGIQATTVMDMIKVHMTPEDIEKSKEEAHALGLKYAQYCRQCILLVTRQLRKVRTGEGYTPAL